MNTPTPTGLSAERLAELKRIAEAAAQGPWTVNFRWGRKTTINGRQRFPIADTGTAPRGEANDRREEANADLIVSAVNALPDLLATLEAQAAELERLRGERDEARAQAGLGCDARNGDAHTVISEGKYQFCCECGETIKTPALTERARKAEARADKAEASLKEAVEGLERIADLTPAVQETSLPATMGGIATEVLARLQGTPS